MFLYDWTTTPYTLDYIFNYYDLYTNTLYDNDNATVLVTVTVYLFVSTIVADPSNFEPKYN